MGRGGIWRTFADIKEQEIRLWISGERNSLGFL